MKTQLPIVLLDTCPQAVIMADEFGTVLHVNKASETLFGYSYEEFVQKPLTETIVPEEHRAAHLEGLERHRLKKTTTIIDRSVRITGQAKSGEIIPIEILLAKHADADGHLIVAYIRDLRDEIEQEEARLASERSDELQKAIVMQEKFIANISHELRTPLNTILGIAQCFTQGVYGTLSEMQREELTAIHDAADHLHALINDVLDLSKYNNADFALSKEDFALETLIEETVSLSGRAPSDWKRIRVDLDDAVRSCTVSLDPVRMKQVLLNLLSNAKKFSEPHTPIVLRVSPGEESRSIRFSVENRGRSIPEAMHEKIFKPFVQVDPTASREYEGHGLGLSIVSRIAELHGGRAFVCPGPSDGVTVCVEIPWLKNPEEDRGCDKRNSLTVGGRSDDDTGTKSILIVDDRIDGLRFMVSFLQSRNWDVVTVTGGAEALRALEDGSFDLVLLDIQMPKMDGFEVLRRIRDNPDPVRRGLPVIMFSGGSWTRQTCLDKGADDFLAKPFKLEKLEELVGRFVGFQ